MKPKLFNPFWILMSHGLIFIPDTIILNSKIWLNNCFILKWCLKHFHKYFSVRKELHGFYHKRTWFWKVDYNQVLNYLLKNLYNRVKMVRLNFRICSKLNFSLQFYALAHRDLSTMLLLYLHAIILFWNFKTNLCLKFYLRSLIYYCSLMVIKDNIP